ncbi:unnamed protein product [Rotaria sp. Silwood2]|nr:unnamed protein product [Rotaria sp. Silwood2]CAF4482045.1 unnamed protein product [Rotaria sp. Silwood2]CAF4488234.1 unnamed protein product [Rotaria sp. Silwood2]
MDLILLIGTNLRYEAHILNARILGPEIDVTYSYEDLEDSINILNKFVSDKYSFSKVLNEGKYPLVILESAMLERSNAASVNASTEQLLEK